MKSGHRVTIGIVHSSEMSAELAIDLAQLARNRSKTLASVIGIANVSLLVRSRNVLVKQFLDDTDSDWLLMFDADQRLSIEAFDKLCEAAHHIERPIVAGLVFGVHWTEDGQMLPFPVLYRWGDDTGIEVIHDYERDAVIEMDAAGTGCLMVHRSVLERLREIATEHMGDEWCWFTDGPINGRWYGEDLLFSRRVTAQGFKIHAHTGAVCAHHKKFWVDDRHHDAFIMSHGFNTVGGDSPDPTGSTNIEE